MWLLITITWMRANSNFFSMFCKRITLIICISSQYLRSLPFSSIHTHNRLFLLLNNSYAIFQAESSIVNYWLLHKVWRQSTRKDIQLIEKLAESCLLTENRIHTIALLASSVLTVSVGSWCMLYLRNQDCRCSIIPTNSWITVLLM